MMYLLGGALIGLGVKLYSDKEKPQGVAPTDSAAIEAKVGDRIMVHVSGFSSPLPSALDMGGQLQTPPDMLPVTVYGVNGDNVYGHVDTTGFQSFLPDWNGTDVSFPRAAIDGLIK